MEAHTATPTPLLNSNGRLAIIQLPLLAREALRALLELETSVRVPTFSFLWTMPVLESAGVLDREHRFRLGTFSEGLASIPSFQGEKPKPGVMAPMLLKRSVSLLERESSWKVAYENCQSLKKRIVQAQVRLGKRHLALFPFLGNFNSYEA